MELKYSKNNNGFYFVCNFHEKDIPKYAGFQWSKNNRVWYTTDPDIAMELQRYASEEVLCKIKEMKSVISVGVEESKAVSSDIEIDCPEGLSYMPFQKAGIAYASKRNNILLADEMGLGKTIQSIGYINSNPLIIKILIVCPATMKLVWKAELEKWLFNKDLSIEVWDSKKCKDADIIIINYESLIKHDVLLETKFSLIIGDEIHYCKNAKNKRSTAFYKIAKRAIKKLYLTGTPILNRPEELYDIIKSLGFSMTWWEYVHRYADAHTDDYGFLNTKGHSNLDELQEKLRSKFMIRRLKKEVLKELPDKVRQIVELSDPKLVKAILNTEKVITEKQILIKELNTIKAEAKANKDKKAYGKAVKELKEFNSSIFTELSRIRHQTALKKTPYAIKHIKGVLENTDKVVVFAHHTDVLEQMHNEFKDCSVILTGKTPKDERKSLVDEFQTDPNVKIFFSSIKAGGVGLTLTASSTVIFVELDWTPSVISQAEDRCHRIGQENSVLIQHLVVNGSIDSKIAKMCVEKQNIISEAIDLDEELMITDLTGA
jgi:SWI/SNF-related matrix-associated actin-dependent regulator 1 of chromatin subfamily A